jgi:hypothetical protein
MCAAIERGENCAKPARSQSVMSVRELVHHAREEDHVLREPDIEVIYVNGYGFSNLAWRADVLCGLRRFGKSR